ncbi:myb/SANT-like DNA-binding domain-containing protein 3 isoform X1 [Pieris napi]|uniref:myb/SANT-like DNA-binding domain-containing protein 3 isoform X1 n=2 Tax=Pieris napi TaxID=78633 RepID=UPI001FBA0BA2|nr:myb/SANT-like DNA-binding domain-containing protein 3 isoform X1 [Pieris napi]
MAKMSRKRVANFTPDEKAVLAQLVHNRPVIESKHTDGKTIQKKKAAWETLTVEFNCKTHVHQRDTGTLKRAWDNMKAHARKVRASQCGELNETGAPDFKKSPKDDLIYPMVEEVEPLKFCEITNSVDSDGVLLSSNDESQNENTDLIEPNDLDIIHHQEQEATPVFTQGYSNDVKSKHLKTADYIRKEAIIRIKHYEKKKRMEMKILEAQLETAESERRAAIMEEERSRIRLEISKKELDNLMQTTRTFPM